MQRIEHLGIAVVDIDQAIKQYSLLLNTICYKRELVKSQQVETAFFKLENHKIELLASTHKDGPITKFIQRKGEGIHHVAFLVNDIHEESERMIKDGFTSLQDKPYLGADNKIVAFFHPKDTHGALIEICQEIL